MRTPLARLITVLWIVCLASTALAQAVETRVALVIGNSRYTAVTPLPNPQRDAAALAQALREAGFSTVQVQNDLSSEAMRRALRDFSKLAENADWAVMYYAGHGVGVGGQNYLIPTDARLKSDRDVSFEAVPLDQVLTSIEGARKLRLVIGRVEPAQQCAKLFLESVRDVWRGDPNADPPSMSTGSLIPHTFGARRMRRSCEKGCDWLGCRRRWTVSNDAHAA